MKKPFRYYSLDYCGPAGAEKRIEKIAKELDKAHIRSIHEYGMTGGDLYRFVRTTLTKEELTQRIQERCSIHPGEIRELPSDYKTLREMTVEEEFNKILKPKPKPKYNTSSVGVCLDAYKWAFSKFNIGDLVRRKGFPKKSGKVQHVTVYPSMSYVFAYWVKGIGPSDIPEDELILVKKGKR